jgi:multidrug transporter EmrE-like cation transporter
MKRIVPMIFLVVFESVADIFATKRWQNQMVRRWVAAIGFYIVCNVFWLFALKNGSWLGRWALIFSIASAGMAILIGMVLFKETFTTLQVIGAWMGIISIVLLTI